MYIKTKGKPNHIDLILGRNLRNFRIKHGISQEDLAAEVGLTFQQIQKYERGTNRIAASRLHEFSHILRIPIMDFYETLDVVTEAGDMGPDFTLKEYELLLLLKRIENPNVRTILTSLIREIGGGDKEEADSSDL